MNAGGASARRPAMRDDLALVEGYHSPQLDVAVRLNTNEAPTAPPAEFARRLAEAVSAEEFNRYPDRGASELREAIGRHEGFPRDNIFAANGSNEVIQSIMLAYGGAGRRSLTFEPTYALHSHIAKVCGTETTTVQRNDDFSLSPGTAADAVRRIEPHVTFLCTPNNPTGLLEAPETVAAVLDAVHEVGGLLVIDEAYGQFAPRSYVDAVAEANSLVVSRTYSKTWSMAGLRLGYLVCPTWVREALESVTLPYHLDATKQAAGTIALDYRAEMDTRVAGLVEQRGIVEQALSDLDVEVWPSASNFILFRPRAIDGAVLWSRLVERSILVRDCSSWPSLDGCLRVTLGTAAENRSFIEAVGEILDGDG